MNTSSRPNETYDGCQLHKAYNSISILQCDITKLPYDCIVNAANRTLLGGGGVDGAIHRAAGPELRAECRTLGGCDTGEAKITQGYRLPAKYVIHTVGPVYSGKLEDARLLVQCYTNSLELAAKHGIHTIAFPAISTGAYRYPLEDATRLAIRAVSTWLSEHPDCNITVTFACYDQNTANVYAHWLAFYKHAGI